MFDKIGNVVKNHPKLVGKHFDCLYETVYSMLKPNHSQEVYRAITRGAAMLTGASKCILLLPEKDPNLFLVADWYGIKEYLHSIRAEIWPPKGKLEIGKIHIRWINSTHNCLVSDIDMPIVPIITVQQVAGMVVLVEGVDGDYLDTINESLKTFGKFAGLAMEKVEFSEGLNSRIGGLSKLIELNQHVLRKGKLEGLLGELLVQVQSISGAEKGGFMLFQEESQELVLQKPAFGVGDDLIDSYRIPLNQSSNAMNVYLSGEPHFSNNAPEDRNIIKRFVDMFAVKNLLTLPITSHGKRIGVLHLLNKHQGEWSERDVRVMGLMANHIGVLIENAYFFKQQMKHENESRALYEISLELASCLDRDKILRLITDKARQLLYSDAAGIFHREQKDRNITLIALSGNKGVGNASLNLSACGSVVSQVMSSGKPMHIFGPAGSFQVELEDFGQVTGDKVEALLAVPLVLRGVIQGALVVWRWPVARAYRDDDSDLLIRFANYAAIAIQNAQSYEEEKKAAEKLAERNQVINTQKFALEKLVNLHYQLMQGVLVGCGIQGIADALGKLVNNPVIVFDHTYSIVASAGSGSWDSAWQSMLGWGRVPESLLRAECLKPFYTRLKVADKPLRLEEISEFGLTVSRVAVPIKVQQHSMGYIYCLESQRVLEETDFNAMEQAATMCAVEIMRQRSAQEEAARYTGEFLLDLVSGHCSDIQAVLNRAAYLGYDLTKPHLQFVVEITQSPSHATSVSVGFYPMRKIQQAIESFLRNQYSGSMFVGHGEGFIIIIPEEKLIKPEYFVKALKQEVNYLFPKAEVYVGLGCTCRKVTDYHQSYKEGLRAVAVGKATGREEELITFDALGVFGLLVDMENKEKLISFSKSTLKSILEYDDINKASLLPTLIAYFQYNGNLQKMAGELHIHKNTVRYRLDKIRHLLGDGFISGERKLELQLASKILELDHRFAKRMSESNL